MSTFVGRREESPQKAAASEPQKAEKSRADLVDEAESLGISVPKSANRAQIQKLIDEADVI